METTTFEKLRWKTRFEQARRKVVDFASAAWEFANEHKEVLVVVVPFVVKAMTANSKDRRVWDPELGYFWQLRRPMNNQEKRFYAQKVAQGESRGDILATLKLLK